MQYPNLLSCVQELESTGELIRVKEPVEPKLEVAEIHRRVFQAKGPAILFENVKGTSFPCVSNLFGTPKRWQFIFRNQLSLVEKVIQLKADPVLFMKNIPSTILRDLWDYLRLPLAGIRSLPQKISHYRAQVLQKQTSILKLPQLCFWPQDGGPFITLPQVFSQSPTHPKILQSNLGMYRVQLAGNDYIANEEVGIHYQIHRGLGIHHEQAIAMQKDLPVSIFVGGPPAHSLAAIMPLPEGLSELIFAGLLTGRRFRYCQFKDHIISADADFCITGYLSQNTKPEGPFGDHLGYYSLQHEFPYLRVTNVFHNPNAIWPFTVVGRPPQEDSSFGDIIHRITKPMVPSSLPGIKQIHAVDEAGVHPLLLAIGSERYVPYKKRKPLEILTQAHAILGFNQCSLAKFVIITARQDDETLDCSDIPRFLNHILERIRLDQDLHFITRTTIDTLDYSGDGLNQGSKLIIACTGQPLRRLEAQLPHNLKLSHLFKHPIFLQKGILCLQAPAFQNKKHTLHLIQQLNEDLSKHDFSMIPLIILCDDSEFTARATSNFLWVTFTRSNPANDIHGIDSFYSDKHWGCRKSLIIDARIKPHHAPGLIEDPLVAQKVDTLFAQKGSLAPLRKLGL